MNFCYPFCLWKAIISELFNFWYIGFSLTGSDQGKVISSRYSQTVSTSLWPQKMSFVEIFCCDFKRGLLVILATVRSAHLGCVHWRRWLRAVSCGLELTLILTKDIPLIGLTQKSHLLCEASQEFVLDPIWPAVQKLNVSILVEFFPNGLGAISSCVSTWWS
jgi:hypothetical protein